MTSAQLLLSLYETARSFSLLYACTPDERAEASLERYVATVLPELSEVMGPSMAALTLRHFKSAVMHQKHRIEQSGASRA